MAKLLFIKANPKEVEHSDTFQLATAFLNEYKQLNPDDEIDVIDLYELEDLKFIDHELLKTFGDEDNIVKRYSQHFAGYDKYVIAAPMWNLGSPAILKAYFDYICQVGITFKYTESGSVGLLSDRPRKAMHVVARGGNYSDGIGKEIEVGDRYIHTILNFFGIDDVRTLAIDNTNVLMGDDLEKARQDAYERARQEAASF